MQTPVIACAADNNYAMSLGVTMLTVARHMKSQEPVRLFVLDGGLSRENRDKLAETWAREPLDVHWVQPDTSPVEGFMTSHHISTVAYYRILLPHVLPKDVERVLYLDSDLLVLDDVTELWNQSLGELWAKAIPDVACPAIDAKVGLAKHRSALPYLASLRPVRNYVELGIEPQSPYFNSGVMLMNLRAWRENDVTSLLLRCLQENSKHIWCWDQYALNAVLAGHWDPLPFRWNVGTHAFEYPDSGAAPMPADEFEAGLDDPAIVHFTTEFKPWHFDVKHPYSESFYNYLDQSAWSGWRPTRPPFRLKTWLDRRGAAVQKRALISFRKLTT